MAKKNFETALARLEQIARELEEGNLSLESSLQKFDEGMKLVQFCSQKLDESQKQIDILLNKNGALIPLPFREEADQSEENS
jgi:exodeoxyribonuclease VII small subunit